MLQEKLMIIGMILLFLYLIRGQGIIGSITLLAFRRVDHEVW
ncbi:MAG: hypothetical protein RBT32_03150 [Methanothermobacter sp.]|nr:hypothetical protein [Methanothermobacter tenebrarum]MDD3454240.1 hypothetical protein [Methanobacteriales archaeon]MDX9693118.1 hypothetical protein [Methanothermobacter sp.]HOQ19946.1 hypothetical protein [Methanothermobacter sp.]